MESIGNILKKMAWKNYKLAMEKEKILDAIQWLTIYEEMATGVIAKKIARGQ